MKLREKLKKKRIEMNITQQQLADETGISQMTYARYESGTRKPSKKNIEVLATFFNVSKEYLLNESIIYVEHTETINDFKEYLIRKELLVEDIDQIMSILDDKNSLEIIMLDDLYSSILHSLKRLDERKIKLIKENPKIPTFET